MTNQKHLSEAALIIRMQVLVIEHLQAGHSLCEVCSIVQAHGAEWRRTCESLLSMYERDEKWLHHERYGSDPSEQELLLEVLVVIENNIEAIASMIEKGE